MGLALGVALKFYKSVAKELKLKVRGFLGLIPTRIEVTGKKLVERWVLFVCPPSWIGLKAFIKPFWGTAKRFDNKNLHQIHFGEKFRNTQNGKD